ncbi:MAG: MEDS domain-containing protein [Rhodocyclaceae bacterium]|nr:MEDS domain-containing protein [Rhodocyclaceae bacterium]
MSEDQLLTIEEAARYLNVSKTSLRRWTKLEKLPCVRVGMRHERRFQKSDLNKFLIVVERSPEAVAATATARLRTARSPRVEETLPAGRAMAAGEVHHIALYFHDRDELWRLFRPYVADHLKAGAPFLYIHDENAREDVLARLRSGGWDPDRLAADGLLKLLVPAESYLRSGTFVPERMIDFMEAAILSWRASGYDKILISGEMTWYLSGAPGVERMMEYESLLNGMLLRYPQVTIVCHYDLHRLSGAVALGGMYSHPHVQLPDRCAPGLFQPQEVCAAA